jgi:hypothetical protein
VLPDEDGSDGPVKGDEVIGWGSNVTITISVGGALILAIVVLLIRARRRK